MSEDKPLFILGLEDEAQGRIFIRFLRELTIEIRSILHEKKDNYEKQIKGINQVNHMVLPLISKLILKEEESYTTLLVMENLSEMGKSYGIEDNLRAAWKRIQFYS